MLTRHIVSSLPVALGLAWALAGCGPAVLLQSSNDFQIRSGTLTTFAYAGGGRDSQVIIVGNPFAGAPEATNPGPATPGPATEAFAARVLAAMQGNHFGPTTRFTTTATAGVRPGFPIVLLFDAPGNVAFADLCRDPLALTSGPGGDRIRLLAGFCAGGETLSWVTSSIPRVSSPDDPAFHALVAQTTRNLIPYRDDDLGDSARDL